MNPDPFQELLAAAKALCAGVIDRGVFGERTIKTTPLMSLEVAITAIESLDKQDQNDE